MAANSSFLTIQRRASSSVALLSSKTSEFVHN